MAKKYDAVYDNIGVIRKDRIILVFAIPTGVCIGEIYTSKVLSKNKLQKVAESLSKGTFEKYFGVVEV